MSKYAHAFRNRSVTITTQFVEDETVLTLDSAPTVSVSDNFGTVVNTGTATTVVRPAGTWEYIVPGQASLRPLVATWTGAVDGSPVTTTTYIEVVGGTTFDLPDLRDTTLRDTTKFTTQDLKDARWYAESRIEDYIGYPVVPRYFYVALDGARSWTYSYELQLPTLNLLSVESLKIDDVAQDLDDVTVYPHKIVLSSASFSAGNLNVVIEGEYGEDRVDGDIVQAAIRLARHYLLNGVSLVPDRMQQMTNEFGTMVLATASGGGSSKKVGHSGASVMARPTGLPEVDSVLVDRCRRLPGMAR